MVDSGRYAVCYIAAGTPASSSHAAAVERERHHVVVADGEDHVEHLLVGEPRGQRFPRRVADPGVVVQLVGSAQQRCIVVAPTAVGDRQLGALHLVVGDVAAQGDQRMLAELVLRRAAPAGSQDQQLAVALASASSWRARAWRTPASGAAAPDGGRACRRCSAASRRGAQPALSNSSVTSSVGFGHGRDARWCAWRHLVAAAECSL